MSYAFEATEKQAVKMNIKDENGNILAAFERNADGDIVEDNGWNIILFFFNRLKYPE